MTDELYERLNKYLNDIFLELNKSDKIFIDNLESINYLNYLINDFYNDSIKNSSKKNNLTYSDVFLLGRKIIEKINPKYLKEYDNLINSGRLDFDYENIISDSYCLFDKITKNKWIDIKRYFNYDDVITLIHEFFHYTAIKDTISYNYNFFSEFISIYFEKIAEKYLIDEKNIPIEEISINSRIISFLHNNCKFYKYGVILMVYESLGNISRNIINYLNNMMNFKDTLFEQECIDFTKKLDEINKLNNKEECIEKMLKLVNVDYRYIIGTVLAYYALNHSKVDDMVKLNDKINSNQYAYLSIYQILNTVDIEMNDNTINESLNIIKSSIYNYDLVKVKC